MMHDDYSHTSEDADGRRPHRTKRRNTAIGLFRRPRNNSNAASTPFLLHTNNSNSNSNSNNNSNSDLHRSKHPTPRGDGSCYNCNSSATENTSLTSGGLDSSHSSSLVTVTPASLDLPPKEQQSHQLSQQSHQLSQQSHQPPQQWIGLPSFIVEIPPIPALDDVSCMMERDDDNDNDSTRTSSTRASSTRTTPTTPVRHLLPIRRYISPSPSSNRC